MNSMQYMCVTIAFYAYLKYWTFLKINYFFEKFKKAAFKKYEKCETYKCIYQNNIY